MGQTAALKQSVVRAVAWTTATRFVGQFASWAMTLVTIRFLHPQDYGLMALTMTIAGLAASLSSGGIIDAVIQDRRATEADMRSVFGLVLLVNGTCLALLWALAYPAAWFYGQPKLVPLLQVASLLFVAGAFQAIPRAALVKRLDLKTVSQIDLGAGISCGALVLILAWAGLGVWALLAGPLLGVALQALGYSGAAGYWCWPSFRFAGLGRILRAGGLRTGENILWYIFMNSDIFIIGGLLGQDLVGIYYVARNLTAIPVRQLAATVKPAAFPAFALLQDDPAAAFRHVGKAVRLVAFVSFPALFGLAAVAPELVPLVLGPRWSAAATPVALLAIAMPLQVVVLVVQPFLAGMGRFAASFQNTLFATILFPAVFAIGAHWGLFGVCAAWLVAGLFQLAYLMRRVSRVAKAPIYTLASPLLAPFAGSLAMCAVVRWLAAVLPVGLGLWTGLVALIATGVLVYSAFTLVMMRPVPRELIELVRR